MKIYQVFEYGGCWEDSYKTCIATFLSNKNAENYMDELPTKERRRVKVFQMGVLFVIRIISLKKVPKTLKA